MYIGVKIIFYNIGHNTYIIQIYSEYELIKYNVYSDQIRNVSHPGFTISVCGGYFRQKIFESNNTYRHIYTEEEKDDDKFRMLLIPYITPENIGSNGYGYYYGCIYRQNQKTH